MTTLWTRVAISFESFIGEFSDGEREFVPLNLLYSLNRLLRVTDKHHFALENKSFLFQCCFLWQGQSLAQRTRDKLHTKQTRQ